MAELEENKVSGVYGGAEFSSSTDSSVESSTSEASSSTSSSSESTSSVYSTTSTTGETTSVESTTSTGSVGTIRTTTSKSLVKNGFWDKFKAFWLQDIDWNTEITVELTPYQQKIEDEINAFLHQEITWSKIRSVFSRKTKA